jgi:hypothetical protein
MLLLYHNRSDYSGFNLIGDKLLNGIMVLVIENKRDAKIETGAQQAILHNILP